MANCIAKALKLLNQIEIIESVELNTVYLIVNFKYFA